MHRAFENKISGKGKDFVQFFANVNNRVNKCRWQLLSTDNSTSLLKCYCKITIQEIEAVTIT
jgi:hypothetical protein